MSDLSSIKLPSGATYNLKDAQARADIANLKNSTTGGMHWVGVSVTALTDHATTSPITIKSGETTAEYTQKSGDVVGYGDSEFVWSDVEGMWRYFGNLGSLKALAFKDNASGSYTPAGSVSTSFTGKKATISSSFTPAGNVTGSVTPAGANAASSVTITPSTTSVYQMNTVGSVTAGSKAACTLPVFSTSVSGEQLTLGWSAGSFTANTPTAVTLPTRAEVKNVWNGYTAASAAAQKFTGSASTISASFAGTAGTATATYTPEGTTNSSFTGTAATITVK